MSRGIYVVHIDKAKLHVATQEGIVAPATKKGCVSFVAQLHNNGYTRDDMFYSSSIDFPKEHGGRATLDYRSLLEDAWDALYLAQAPATRMPEQLPAKCYVLMQAAWEYNDEFYYKPDDEPGFPKAVYANKVEAERACKKLNLRHAAESDVFEHFNQHSELSYDQIVSMPWLLWRDWLLEHDVTPPGEDVGDETAAARPSLYELGDWWDDNHSDWTKAQRDAVLEHLNLEFWEVVEVPADPALALPDD